MGQEIIARDNFVSRDIWHYLETCLFVTTEGLATAICWVEVKDGSKHPTMHKAVQHSKGLSGTKCQ